MNFCERTSRRTGGFTLLELILALGLMSMVLASMYASMNVAFRARRAADRNVMPIRSAAIAADLVCQDLESVPPPTGILAGPFIGTYADGAQPNTELDVLDFYTVGEDVPPAQQTQVLQ